jgi:hypothetical protein
MAAGRPIPVRVADIEIEVAPVPVAGTGATSGGRAAKAARNVADHYRLPATNVAYRRLRWHRLG